MHRGLYAETLRHAARTLGGARRLARFLAVDPLQLHNWMAGKEPAPLSVFLRTLDVIADGPYARERRLRVAAIPSEDDTATRS